MRRYTTNDELRALRTTVSEANKSKDEAASAMLAALENARGWLEIARPKTVQLENDLAQLNAAIAAAKAAGIKSEG